MIQLRLSRLLSNKIVSSGLGVALALILALLSTPAVQGLDVWYVDDDTPLGGDGETWQTAFTYLQDALAYAADGDEIRVAGGTYTPDRDELGFVTPFDRDASFVLPMNIKLYGGYAGRGAPDPDARDVALYETILSGDLLENDGPGFVNYADNTDIAVYADYVGLDAVFDGFTVRACYPHGSRDVAAMKIGSGSIRIASCCFRDNGGTNEDYGALLTEADSTIIETTFVNNRCHGGGAMTAVYGPLTMIDCVFIGNRSLEPTLHWGGAVNVMCANAEFTNCIFTGNSAGNYGGALMASMSPTLITNCLFSGNQARTGGAVWFTISDLTIANSTFVGNHAAESFGGLYVNYMARAEIANSIFWNNTDVHGDGESSQIDHGDDSSVSVAFSCIENYLGSFGTTGVLSINPSFTDADGPDDTYGTPDDDLTLQADSPCIDAGDNLSLPWDLNDLDQDGVYFEPLPFDLTGRPRFLDDPDVIDTGNGYAPIVDMGAYEYQVPGLVISASLVKIPEGATASFTVALAMPPLQPLEVTILHYSGDPDISVVGGSSLWFNATDYDQPQTVTLAAAIDGDDVHGIAEIEIACSSYQPVYVHACEIDSEALPTVIHVNAAAQPGGDGASWQTAFTDLQDALLAADAIMGNVEIWVAAGTYRPDSGTGDPLLCFSMRDNVAIMGGFAGDESSNLDRDSENQPTILSGDLGEGVFAYHVVIADNCDVTAVLDGFTIRDGHAEQVPGPDPCGGGLYGTNTAARVVNCTFTENYADEGAAVAVVFGNPSFHRCRFAQNHGTLQGGAVYSRSADVIFSECDFTDHQTRDVVWFGASHVWMVNCRFIGNHASYWGVINKAGGDLYVMNSTFTGNQGHSLIYNGGDWLEVVNCALSGNQATGIEAGSYAGLAVRNTIFWDNSYAGHSGEGVQITALGAYLCDIRYCCVQGWTGGYGGIGNHGLDPLFVDADGADDVYGTLDDDLRLTDGSPCIDSGSNYFVLPDFSDLDADGNTTEATPLDLDLEGRFFDDPNTPDGGGGVLAIVDMGAYEFGGNGPQYCKGDLTGDGETQLADLAVLLLNYGLAENAQPCQGDIDYDGDVDLADLADLLTAYARACD